MKDFGGGNMEAKTTEKSKSHEEKTILEMD